MASVSAIGFGSPSSGSIQMDPAFGASVVKKRTDTGSPVALLNWVPLAVVKFIALRRMNWLRK